MRRPFHLFSAALAALLVAPAPAQSFGPPHADWTTPIAPFRIADNLYYVGSKDLASYLITTPAGDILINSGLTTSPSLIRASIKQLGFRMSDVKILLISHAHYDHAAGSAQLLRWTHAKYMVMDGDVGVVQSGGRTDFAYPDDHYPPARVDRVLHDGSTVTLGGVTLTAHKTAGHTRGATAWTMQTVIDGRPENVVIVGGWSTTEKARLVPRPHHPTSYPGIAADFQRTFATLHSLPCDIFLGAHGGYFNMLAKLDRMKAGEGKKVWIDPDGYKAAVGDHEHAFEKELQRQQSGLPPS